MAFEKTPRKIPLVFFRNDAGGEPVRDWLKELGRAERYAIGTDLLRAQWRWPAGMPLCRPMGRGLWEGELICPVTVRHAFSFVSTRDASWHYMASLKRREPLPRMI